MYRARKLENTGGFSTWGTVMVGSVANPFALHLKDWILIFSVCLFVVDKFGQVMY